ncbi:synapse-associated protein 1-like isoform X2 [Lates japonicus]|uniref:Synapse-associated protein 1-like isoform X2 n=1 Tax=Lates japonicus TaxID=270547 RepID=A0AAD3M751_LATJO|nr:synapse-associated protein 1-like isoform X2 [Lates japonicus]
MEKPEVNLENSEQGKGSWSNSSPESIACVVTMVFPLSFLFPPSEDYIFSFASSATQEDFLTQWWEIAQTIKKTVEEGCILWLQWDVGGRPALNCMRADLVPKHVKEDVFWRNYFYRVSLIKQSAQLTALAAQQQQKDGEDRGTGVSPEDVILTDNVRPKTPPVSISDIQKPPQEEEEEMSTSPGVSEFVSDAFDSTSINQEDLRKEMEQLVLDKKESSPSPDDESADWEKELQQELQEYEVVTESDNKDDQWDQEIEKMLQAADS